jgi:low affinity Fe/Cu permease
VSEVCGRDLSTPAQILFAQSNFLKGGVSFMARKKTPHSKNNRKSNGASWYTTIQDWFAAFAQGVARLTGRPATFLLALTVIIVWAVTGPIFGYSDTWQLVINTGTTIVTFLMVFLIQNTQNRDALAVQLKLAEVILAMKGVPNKFAVIEDLTDEELEDLHKKTRQQADQTLEYLEKRKASKAKAKA